MIFNHLVLAAWRVLWGGSQLRPAAGRDVRNYSLPRLGDPENVRDPVARLERGVEAFVVTAARAASGA